MERFCFTTPVPVAIAKNCGVNCKQTIGVLLGVLLPQQLLGHSLALEFLMNHRPIGHLKAAGWASVGVRIKQPRKFYIVKISRQRPAKLELGGF